MRDLEKHREYTRKWKAANKKRLREYRAKWYAEHKDAELSNMAIWRQENAPRVAEYTIRYVETHKPQRTAIQMKRHTAKMQRTPSWLTSEDYEVIKQVYVEAAALGYEVDHIYPLQGKTVSGLHVPWNLQAIPKALNRSKYNRHPDA
jgi:hypothetical protein